MALVMVARAAERRGAPSGPSVRLVQDFGCPEGIAQPTMTMAAPVHTPPGKHGRARPPGRPEQEKRRAADAAGELTPRIGGHDGCTAKALRTQRLFAVSSLMPCLRVLCASAVISQAHTARRATCEIAMMVHRRDAEDAETRRKIG